MQIDELVVSLLLDASGFTKGQKDAAAAAQKGAADLAAAAGKGEKASTTAFEAIVAGLNRVATANEKSNERGVQAQKRTIESNKKVGESFEGAIRTGLTFLAVLAGARTVEDFTRKVTALDAALGRTAAGMGSSPQVLSGLGKAVERMGGDFNGAVAGMRALSDAYQDFRTTGSSALTEPLTRLQALSGKAVTFGKDTLANFESIADAIQALDQKGEHALADRLGRQILGSEDLTNLAKRGGPAVRAELAESARHGVVDPKDVEAAQKLQTAYVGLSQSVVGLGTKIETALSPYLTQLLTQLDELIEKHGNEWVQEFGAFLEKHKPDIEHFGTAIGDLAKSVEGIASSFSSGSPATVALEAFAALMAGRVIGAVTGLTSAMRVLGSLPIPGVLAGALGLPVLGAVAVAGVLASGDPNKALLDGGRPDVEPQDNNTGLPGVNDDARSDTSDAKAKVDQAGGLWDKFKKAIGWGDRLHDDAKTKEGVEDTAKNTKGILEVMKAQKDGLGADATVNAGGGASLGGGASNLRYGHRGGGSSGAYRGTPVPDAPYNGKNIDGLTEAQSKQYAAILGNRESGNRYGTTNPYGYVGRWQFGASALAENGYVRPGTTNAGLNDPNSWTGKGDVHSIAEWKANKGGVQDQALGEYTNRHYAQLKAAGVIRDGMGPSEVAGWLAAAHLKGVGGAVALSRGRDNVDANGTSASSYRRMMDGVGKGAGAAGPTAQAPVSAGTPATAVTDAEVFAARQRISAGGRDPKDIALRDRYLKEQNTPPAAPAKPRPNFETRGSDGQVYHTADMRDPKYAPKGAATPAPTAPWHQSPLQATKGGGANALTDLYGAGFAKQPVKVDLTHDSAHRIGQATVGHVGREFLHAMRQAQRLTHHEKTPSGLHPAVHAALNSPAMENHRALMAGARDAAVHRHSVVHHVDRRSTSKMTIGSLAVHTQATDAKGMVADLEPVFRRASDAGDFNYGLDG